MSSIKKKFSELLEKVPGFIKSYNRLSMGISAHLDDLIKIRFKSQKEFADLMGKNESEISKWLSGKHNFTIKTVAQIESKLNVKLLYTHYDYRKHSSDSFLLDLPLPNMEVPSILRMQSYQSNKVKAHLMQSTKIANRLYNMNMITIFKSTDKRITSNISSNDLSNIYVSEKGGLIQ
jgi:transcriptional regulator with XRE-family HTH domain